MNEQNYEVLINIIGAVESGGQIYGNRRYNAYADPYTNSPKEHTITLGAFQSYGSEARELVQMIYDASPSEFAKIDTDGSIKTMLGKDWVALKWKPSTTQKSRIIRLIDSEYGHIAQDRQFRVNRLEKYIARAESYGVKDVKAQMMWAEIQHLGGVSPTERIFKRCNGDYSLDSIMASLKKDQADGSSSNQVGDKVYWSRHVKCRVYIEKYAVPEDGMVQTDDKEESTMDFTKYYGKISNSGSDERGAYSGGKAGDQTGTEWQIRSWYNRPWSHVIRHPDKAKRELIAELAIEAANNNKIGYDQNQRHTFWQQLKASGYRPKNITMACEADCSAGVAAIVKAVGYLTGDAAMQRVSSECYSGNIRSALKAAGFTVYTASKYRTSTDYLLPGDILLYENHHVATNLGIGSKMNSSETAKPTPAPSKDWLSKGDTGEAVKELQRNLNTVINAGLDVDGSFGSLTDAAVRAFQKKYGLEIDGCYGVKSKAKMQEVLTGSTTASGKFGTIIAYKLNVRTGPGLQYGNLTSYPFLANGNEVDVIEVLGDWVKIKIAGKYTGYVSRKYIQIH